MYKTDELVGKNHVNKKICEPSDVKFVLNSLYDIDLGRKPYEEVSNIGFKRVNKETSKTVQAKLPEDRIID